jgi:hypothetical protein
MEVSLERAGKFHAKNMKPNSHKCASMKTRTYHYQVKVWATDKRLTPEKYVLNNETVQVYFDTRWGRAAGEWDAVSCEMLAITSAKELCKLCQEQADVLKVSVSILGSNKAWITAVCLPEDVN